MSNENNGSFWPVILFAIGLAVAIQMIAGSSSTTSSSTPATVDTNSFEYRYARERFRQEGMSTSDADTAAKAVAKFQEAQRARSR